MLTAVLAEQEERTSGGTAADAMLAVADGLAAHDFDVLDPAWEGSRYLKVTNARNALSEIIISEHGLVSWEYRPFNGGAPAPVQVTDMVMDVLGANGDKYRCACPWQPPGLTLKSTVGRALREYGMQVHLAEMDRDDDFGELLADIMVFNPVRRDRGWARVGDDGMIRWECRLRDPTAGSKGIDPDELAGAIARALVRAAGQQESPAACLTGTRSG
jgi:hypothetical protein